VALALAGMALLWLFLRGHGPGALPRRPLLPDLARSNEEALRSLQEELLAFISGRSGEFHLYYKDLGSGCSLGIRDREEVRAASLVKLPLVLYLHEQAAQNQLDLRERVAYDPDRDYRTGAGILQYTAREGDTYSLRTLATLSIVLSDNVATAMLFRRLGRENVAAFMKRLGGEVTLPEGRNVTTARDMARYAEEAYRFARRNPELGRRFLDDLAHSIYHTGLPGKLPPSLTVAHKEGLIEGLAGDAGIVFADPSPYVLSVIIEGIRDVDGAFSDIAGISRLVYDFHRSRRLRSCS